MKSPQDFLSSGDLKQYLLRKQYLKSAAILALSALESLDLQPQYRSLEKAYWHIADQALRENSILQPGLYHFSVPRAHFGFVAQELQALGYIVGVRQLEVSEYALFEVTLP